MNKISIVMPVYNAEDFLKTSIESVINQTYKNIELLLINDGSLDKSEEICKNHSFNDSRIHMIKQNNGGPAAARNTGIKNATGDFIFFLDADDYIIPNALELLVNGYKDCNPDLVMGNFAKIENDGRFVKQRVSFNLDNKSFEDKTKLLFKPEIASYVRHFLKYPSNHLVSYCWARLYKSSIIKENNLFANPKMRLFEDYTFNLDYLKHAKNLLFLNEPVYTYIMHNNTISASAGILNTNRLLHDMDIFVEKTIDFFNQKGLKQENGFDIRNEIGHSLTHYAIIFLIRSCRNVNRLNKNLIYDEIDKLISSPLFKENLKYYSPLKGNSRALPLLAKFGLTNLIISYCEYKARKRYGKIKE